MSASRLLRAMTEIGREQQRLAMIVVAGVVIAAVGLIVALV